MTRRYEPTRSPYWVIGMHGDEPWTAVAQTNVGIRIVPCGIDADRAREVVERWHSVTQARRAIEPDVFVVGATVVDPLGRASGSWGRAPKSGGASLWAPIMRLRLDKPVTCLECYAERWAGCWVAVDMRGCSVCLRREEVADPRVWPAEPGRPGVEAVAPRSRPARPRSTVGRPAGRRGELASPGQTRIA